MTAGSPTGQAGHVDEMDEQGAADWARRLKLEQQVLLITPAVMAVLPEATQIQLIRDAIDAQNTDLLASMQAAGLFSIERPETYGKKSAHASFNQLEHPAVASWAALISLENAFNTECDPLTNVPYRSAVGYVRRTLSVPGELKRAFQACAENYLQEFLRLSHDLAPGPACGFNVPQEGSLLHHEQKRFISTCGSLLSTACALNDAPLVRRIARALAEVTHRMEDESLEVLEGKVFADTNTIESSLMVSERIFSPSLVRVSRMIHPVQVAIEFAHFDCLQAFMDHGFDPINTTLRISTVTPSSALGDSLGKRLFLRKRNNTNQIYETAVDLMAKAKQDGHVSVVSMLLDGVENHRGALSLREQQELGHKLRSWGLEMTMGDELQLDMLDLAMAHDVFRARLDNTPATDDPDLTDLATYQHSIRSGCIDLFRHIAPSINFDDPHTPNPLFLLFNSSTCLVDHPDHKLFAEALVEELVLMERGDLLVRPIDPELFEHPDLLHVNGCYTAIMKFAQRGLASAVLRCLENGADAGALNAEKATLIDVCQAHGHHEVEHVVRSFTARQEAHRSIEEIKVTVLSGKSP